MNFKSITLISSLITIASAAVGNINDFKNYPGIVDLIQANTQNYKTNFKYTFTDGPIYSGDGTAYGDATSGGNCLFPKKEYYNDMMYAALNNKQYNLDMGCGLCAVVVSTSNPYKAIRVRIIDQCPECEHGSLDFSDKAFKALSNKTPDRIKITWALIPCDIDVNEFPALVKKDSPIKFQFKSGSTQFWGEVEVFNTRYPVAKVEFNQEGKYVELSRRAYNYWSLTSGGFGQGPYTFRVTLADDTVIEAKGVEMVIPGDDEGDDFSSGTQTIIKAGSTSSGSNSSGSSSSGTAGNNNNNNNNNNRNNNNNNNNRNNNKNNATTTTRKVTTTKPSTSTNNATSTSDDKCPNSMIRQGYKCCEENNCNIYYKDYDGDWGITTNFEWCGIRFNCPNTVNKESSDTSCDKKFNNMGYKCCNACNVILKDETGKWGVENNEWCGIRNDCK